MEFLFQCWKGHGIRLDEREHFLRRLDLSLPSVDRFHATDEIYTGGKPLLHQVRSDFSRRIDIGKGA